MTSLIKGAKDGIKKVVQAIPMPAMPSLPGGLFEVHRSMVPAGVLTVSLLVQEKKQEQVQFVVCPLRLGSAIGAHAPVPAA